ncbi:hypothetical protein [Streptomyces flavalbus]|uniref:Uncharacterized protein n=1 Tax=Streptomyces flavalbus TaxID=2665155 RepID=A0ABW2WJ52_9ACTN
MTAHDAAQHTAPGGRALPASADGAPHAPPDPRALRRLPRSALVEALLRNAGHGAGPERPRWESAV